MKHHGIIAVVALLAVMAGGAELVIVKAEYGAHGRAAAETGFSPDGYDVAEKIRALLVRGEREIKVNGDVFGDPAPMVGKTLRATVRYDNTPLEFRIAEGGLLDLRESTLSALAATAALAASYHGPVKIIRAEYGAGGKTADVTERVKALLAGGNSRIKLTNGNFGDPAPRMVKKWKIDVEYQGRGLVLRGKEGVELDLSEKRISDLIALEAKGASAGGSVEIVHAE